MSKSNKKRLAIQCSYEDYFTAEFHSPESQQEAKPLGEKYPSVSFNSDEPSCNHSVDVPGFRYVCTRAKGHRGLHVGCGISDNVCAIWERIKSKKGKK